jgi:hypothetical protein
MTGIFTLDLCGNRSGGAKPRSTALGGIGSMPIMSWLRLYEFMVLPDKKTSNMETLYSIHKHSSIFKAL